ncbi:S24 family peptidase [Mycoplasma sp. P36-A1]|uniref:S24 family peptidase n=1 Tax=Mycoplasma sp. P36-A1 TaxID=3252900 RepID=UPI003C2F8DF7
MDRRFFGLRIKGDSIYPKYQNGDTVIFKMQSNIDYGQEALVYVNGYDATFKKVIKSNKSVILQPLNSEFSPIIVEDDETFSVAGVPV